MHAFFITRGNKDDVEKVINHLHTQPFYMPITLQDGKEVKVAVNGMIQPVQLWSYVFPHNYLDAVLNTLRFDKENINRYQGKKFQMFTNGLRIALGAEKIPTFKQDKTLFVPQDHLKNIAIYPIGIKRDIVQWKDPDGTIHEAL